MSQAPEPLDAFSFVQPLAVRWGDMDSVGHVNNAKFFTYDETARLDYFHQLMAGDPRFWKDYGLILARIECDFLAQVKAPAVLQIGFRIASFGRTSMRTRAVMYDGGRPCAVSQAVLVWFDYARSTALPLPADVRERIVKLEKTPPAGA